MKHPGSKLPSGPMLMHFTRTGRRGTALDNLVAILAEGRLRASARMVRSKRAVVCFFDTSFGELAAPLSRRNRRRYEPFGVAIDKRYAFQMGARPVIYLPWREARAMLAPDELWRVVTIEMGRIPPVDWSFEREWRIAGDLGFDAAHAVALVETWQDAETVFDRFDGSPPCAGVIPLRDLLTPRRNV